jgi:hypothetical protein
MGVGETLDAAIRLYRADWKTLMLIVAVIAVPFTVIQDLAVKVVTKPALIGGRLFLTHSGLGAIYGFFLVNFLVVQPILRGSMVRALAGLYLGERPKARESLRFALSKLGPLLVAIILSSLVIALGIVALVIPGIIFAIRYEFVTSAVVVERKTGREALGRSWRLTKGIAMRIFGTLFLAGLIAGIISTILLIPSLAFQVNGTLGTNVWIARAVLGSIASVITTPFATAVGVLLYFDARIRKEAFDLAVMAREVSSVAP